MVVVHHLQFRKKIVFSHVTVIKFQMYCCVYQISSKSVDFTARCYAQRRLCRRKMSVRLSVTRR